MEWQLKGEDRDGDPYTICQGGDDDEPSILIQRCGGGTTIALTEEGLEEFYAYAKELLETID